MLSLQPGGDVDRLPETATLTTGRAAVTPVLGGLVAEHAGWPAMLVLGAIAAAGALIALRRLREPVPAG